MIEKEEGINALRASLQGELFEPDDECYDAARKVVNPNIKLVESV